MVPSFLIGRNLSIAPLTGKPVKNPPKQAHPFAWERGPQTIAYLALAVLTGALIWLLVAQMDLPGARRWWGYVLFLLLGIIFTFTLARGLKGTRMGWKWRGRLVFLLGAGLTGLIVIVQSLLTGRFGFSGLFLLLLAPLGALAGGLALTAVHMGLWENNSPPPAEIEARVLRVHRDLIGRGDPIPWAKRGFDILLAGFGLLISMPVWVLSVFLIWIEDPGPVLFVKNSVGRGGANFKQYKLRTMVRDAEGATGPVLADEADGRVLKAGRVLRKTALDELPQLLNILSGDMSFVGPRPQRTVLVHDYLARMPEYAERHRVLPGLAGLAQVAGDYYLTPRQKLRFDRLYIRYSGLGYDLLLLFLAFLITFWYRWIPDWDGRLPRRLLHMRQD
jgi:lipopolysaccharide/colanic/teichoic acid biosynthesis glycosyltransferase